MSMGANFDEDTFVTSVRKVSSGVKSRSPNRGNTPEYFRTVSLPNEKHTRTYKTLSSEARAFKL